MEGQQNNANFSQMRTQLNEYTELLKKDVEIEKQLRAEIATLLEKSSDLKAQEGQTNTRTSTAEETCNSIANDLEQEKQMLDNLKLEEKMEKENFKNLRLGLFRAGKEFREVALKELSRIKNLQMEYMDDGFLGNGQSSDKTKHEKLQGDVESVMAEIEKIREFLTTVVENRISAISLSDASLLLGIGM